MRRRVRASLDYPFASRLKVRPSFANWRPHPEARGRSLSLEGGGTPVAQDEGRPEGADGELLKPQSQPSRFEDRRRRLASGEAIADRMELQSAVLERVGQAVVGHIDGCKHERVDG